MEGSSPPLGCWRLDACKPVTNLPVHRVGCACCGVCRSFVSSLWMPGWRPRKVDCTSDSSASVVAVVVVLIFGHVDDEERTLGDFGVGGVSSPATPDRVSETYIGDSGRGQKTGSDLKVFPGESSVLWHWRRRCLRVSLPSWGRRCGYLLRVRAPGENP
jgi:hypothetical protein